MLLKSSSNQININILLPKAIPSAAACTTRPNVAVHVALGFDITEFGESRTNRNKTVVDLYIQII